LRVDVTFRNISKTDLIKFKAIMEIIEKMEIKDEN